MFFDTSAANLFLGTNNTGSGGIDGTLTFYSSGNGVNDPTLSASSNGNLILTGGSLGIGIDPVSLDADNNLFALEVVGTIGPSADAIYDLGAPGRTFRDLYLSGTTTAGGDITISNADPSILFNDTTIGEDQYSINIDASSFEISNDTDARIDFAIDGIGNIDLAGGSGATGCSITNTSGNLTCTGNIQTISGAIEANGGSITSTATTLTIDSAGDLAINDVVGITGSLGSLAALSINQLNSGDILTASASGVTRFRVTNTGELDIGDNNSTFSATLDPTTLTANRTLIAPDEDGTLCLQGSLACGFTLRSENYWQINNNVSFS